MNAATYLNPGAVFTQEGYRCRVEWGRRGAAAAAERGDILVVVDTLRFSTTAVTAVHHGVILYPYLWKEDSWKEDSWKEDRGRRDTGAGEKRNEERGNADREGEDIHGFAQRVGAIAGGQRAGEDARYTLSPLRYLHVEPGTRIVLASPNGATCARYARSVPALFVGALINAQAVGLAVSQLLETTRLNVTVLACGERWLTQAEDGNLRFAIEDYLGAGAILSHLPQTKSPEARLCTGAFEQAMPVLEEMLLECGSGRELQARGQADDVRHAARLNRYDTVPVMRDEYLTRLEPDTLSVLSQIYPGKI